MLLGAEDPDAGSITVGSTVNMVSVGQERLDSLDPAKTVYDEISEGQDEIELGTNFVQSRAYMSWFGFRGGMQQATVGNLSGGERNRLQLAKLLKAGANVIILDGERGSGLFFYREGDDAHFWNTTSRAMQNPPTISMWKL
mmetsp:Transcript_36249/g.84792  ORF Transcript_36249/g.84792 Transcript_36249/m.84792 type:complete len:141 (-) Transcript_36249:465-887(-)